MNSCQAFSILPISNKPLIYSKKSLIENAGIGLFAKEYIPKNTPIVIYFGNILSNQEVLSLYSKNKPEYITTIAPYLRDSGNSNIIIDGRIDLDNINLMGKLVNDYSNLDNGITHYLESHTKCNVIIKETHDFPIYYSLKNINKGEELYAHYGLGYWLLLKGIEPDQIKNYISQVTN